MKKLLALVLALVMTLGLATVGANAATYSDADSISYKEAVDVMSAIGVFDGQDGKFNPTGTLTREQGAKIIAYMILGKTAADAMSTASAPFDDVAADRWSAGSIAYCVSEGIIGGVGNNKFNPEGPLTGYAFAKMLLCALGYNAKQEGFNNNEWQINTAKLARTAGLMDDLSSLVMSQGITREQACQMALNTEQATMVEYAGGIDVSTSDGTTVTAGATRNDRAEYGTHANYDKIGADAGLQFCEEYATKLEKRVGTADDFARPSAYAWYLNNEKLYNKISTDKIVLVGKKSADEVAAALSGYYLFVDPDNGGTTSAANPSNWKLVNNTWQAGGAGTDRIENGANGDIYNVNNNGVAVWPLGANQTLAAAIAAKTMPGKVLEFHYNDDNQITNVIGIMYSVTTVSAVSTSGSKTIYTLKNGGTGTVYGDANSTDTIKIVGADSLAKGDTVTFVRTGASKVYVYPTTEISATQSTKVTSTVAGTAVTTLTLDGTQYVLGTDVSTGGAVVTTDTAVTAVDAADYKNSATAAKYYIDVNGFVVKTTAAVNDNYAFITDVYGSVSSSVEGKTPKVEVRAVLSDGTVGTYTLALKKLSSSQATEFNTKYTNPRADVYNGSDGTTITARSGATGGITAAQNDWVIDGTDVLVFDAANNEDKQTTATLSSILNNVTYGIRYDVYAYTLDGTTMTLDQNVTRCLNTTPAYAADTTYFDKGAVIYNGNGLDHNETSWANTNTIIADANTKIVAYNADKKTATVYAGTTSLPSSFDGLTDVRGGTDAYGYAIVDGTGTNVGTATYIFAATTAGATADTNNYAFIDAAKVTITGSGSSTTYTYTAAAADGSEVTLTKSSAVAGTDIYLYGDDNKVGERQNNTTFGAWGATTANRVAGQDLVVASEISGDMIKVDKTGGSEWIDTSSATIIDLRSNPTNALSISNVGVSTTLNVKVLLAKTSSGTLDLTKAQTIWIFGEQ